MKHYAIKNPVSVMMWIFFISLFCCQKLKEPSTNSCQKLNEPSTESQTVLPAKLILSDPIYTDEMDSFNGWVVTNGEMVLNTSEKYSGTGSLKTINPSGSGAQLEKTGIKINMSADCGMSLRLWAYPHNDVLTNIGAVWLLCSNTSNYWSKAYKYTLNVRLGSLVTGKWNLIIPYEWAKKQLPDWSNINFIYINTQLMRGKAPQVSYDRMTYGAVYKPAVLITFDDNDASVYSSAYPLLKTRNMVGTAYVSSYTINSGGKMTSAQLQELYANGWSIGNHTANHTILTGVTEAEVQTELSTCKTVLDGLGFSRDSQHVAYPDGAFDDRVLGAMTTWGAKTGRNIINQLNGCEPEMAYQIYARSVPYTETLATVKSFIDKAVSSKGVYVLTFHDLVDGEPASGQWKTSDFSSLLDYIAAQGLQTLTIDEYYRLYSGSISVNHK